LTCCSIGAADGIGDGLGIGAGVGGRDQHHRRRDGGYWATGIANMASRPATTSTMETTAASRGRSTKVLEIMAAS
jgi:hypothetical protein